MGTGVAAQLVRHMQPEPALIVLIQPYISIQELLKSLAGPLKCLASLFKPVFDTGKVLDFVSCPVLIIHGDRDPLIPLQHSEYLIKKVKQGRLDVRAGCTHIHYDREKDISFPIRNFMQEFSISPTSDYSDTDAVEIL